MQSAGIRLIVVLHKGICRGVHLVHGNRRRPKCATPATADIPNFSPELFFKNFVDRND